MLSQSSFEDRSLVESFYGELFNRFYTACNSRIQTLLQDCAFGIALNPNQIVTFFIVAPNHYAAEKLTQYIDNIIDQAVKLMPGIEQTAICYVPEGRVEQPTALAKTRQKSSHSVVARFFPNISVS